MNDAMALNLGMLDVATHIALVAAGIFFLMGLLSGSWKYFGMINSDKGRAPYYVDIAHRASLMYAFAALLIAVFAQLSVFSDVVNCIAALGPLIFFFLAIMGYIIAGIKNDTNNILRQHPHTAFMWALMVAEIGGVLVLFVGYLLTFVQ